MRPCTGSVAQPTTSLCSCVETQRDLGFSIPRLPQHQAHLAKRAPRSHSPGAFIAFLQGQPLSKPMAGLGLTPGFPLSAEERGERGHATSVGSSWDIWKRGCVVGEGFFFKAGGSWSSSRHWEQDRWQSPANPDGQAKPSPVQLPGMLPSSSSCLQGPTCSHRLTQPQEGPVGRHSCLGKIGAVIDEGCGIGAERGEQSQAGCTSQPCPAVILTSRVQTPEIPQADTCSSFIPAGTCCRAGMLTKNCLISRGGPHCSQQLLVRRWF